MEKVSELFANCAWRVPYETIGKDVNYAFVEKGTTLYIYFQGSKGLDKKGAFWDWYRNFAFFPKWRRPYKDMKTPYKVHGGFLDAWKEVEDIVIAKIQEKVDDEFKWKEIIVVGYSHGGALSGLCFECCQFWRHDLHEKDLIHGYGFESPRFFHGYKIPKKLQNRWKNYYVFRDKKDIVTHCPPWLFKFHHVGTLIKLEGKSAGLIKDHFPSNVYNALVQYEEEKDNG